MKTMKKTEEVVDDNVDDNVDMASTSRPVMHKPYSAPKITHQTSQSSPYRLRDKNY